jgi:hypothetical protein
MVDPAAPPATPPGLHHTWVCEDRWDQDSLIFLTEQPPVCSVSKQIGSECCGFTLGYKGILEPG